MRRTRRRSRGAIGYLLMPPCAITAGRPHRQEAGMISYPDYDDYGTRDQAGYGLGPGDCPACRRPPANSTAALWLTAAA